MFLSRNHDRKKGKTQNVSKGLNVDQAWTKSAENLHKRAHAQFAILPTDAFKLHVYEQKDASPCAGKHFSTNSEKNVLKAFFDITFYCKQGCKLPIIYTWKAKTLLCSSFYKTI